MWQLFGIKALKPKRILFNFDIGVNEYIGGHFRREDMGSVHYCLHPKESWVQKSVANS